MMDRKQLKVGAGQTYVSADWLIEQGYAENRIGIIRKIETEGFPRPVKLGARTVRWIRSEVEEWGASRPRVDYVPERRKHTDKESAAA